MRFLRTALFLNATSCIVFGALFLAFSESVSRFIGNSFIWMVPAIGAVLLLNGLHLLVASRRSRPICPEILYFVAGDALWVIGTLALIGFGLVITTAVGTAVSLAVAVMVGAFGVMQVVGYKRVCAAA